MTEVHTLAALKYVVSPVLFSFSTVPSKMRDPGRDLEVLLSLLHGLTRMWLAVPGGALLEVTSPPMPKSGRLYGEGGYLFFGSLRKNDRQRTPPKRLGTRESSRNNMQQRHSSATEPHEGAGLSGQCLDCSRIVKHGNGVTVLLTAESYQFMSGSAIIVFLVGLRDLIRVVSKILLQASWLRKIED